MRKTIRNRVYYILIISWITLITGLYNAKWEEENAIDIYENKYEHNVLQKRCYLNQIKRLYKNKEIAENYCEDEQNLANFRLEEIKETVWQPTPQNASLNLDNLAYAIAMAETWNCKLWFGKMYNNCFWIKDWNTAPCKKTWRLNMCIYDSPEESYERFKIIWQKWYVTFPTLYLRTKWTWADHRNTWLENVTHYYYN